MIESQRLLIIPLKADEILDLLDNRKKFEEEQGYTYDGEEFDEVLDSIYRGQYTVVKNNPNDYIWNTFWIIVLKETKTIIGGIDYKYTPINYTTEIGYGIGMKYYSKGYTTEAVKGMCDFAFASTRVNKIIACTDLDNYASQKVLLKNNFTLFEMKDNLNWYELKKA